MPGPERNRSARLSGVDAHHAFAPGDGGGHVEAALFIERHALRPAQTAVEGLDFAFVGDAVHGVEARGGGSGDVEVAVRSEGQVVGGDGRFQRGEDEDLAAGTDLENGAAAIAHVEILLAIEGDSGGHAHAFHEHGHVAVGRDLVDEAIVAAGDVQHALAIEGQRGGVHQLVDERLHGEVQIDLVDRDRDFLAARSAEGGVDIAEGIDRGVGDGMQAIGQQHADVARPGFAGLRAAFDHQFAGGGAFRHARDDEGIRADDHRRADFPDRHLRPIRPGKPLPPNLQLTAGDSGGRGDRGDAGLGIRWFPERHNTSKD